MVRIAVVVVQVSLQRHPRLSLGVSGIGAALLLEPVAIVPTGTMLRPQPHAHPAELIFALPARHVVATAVLFNGGVAFGALLGVCGNPIGSLAIVRTFL